MEAGILQVASGAEGGLPRNSFSGLAAALGEENVVRVEFAPGIDSQGEGAINVTVVIAPDAVQRLTGDATIDARARLRERLEEMGVNSTPIVYYATEAELAEDVGS
jgi:hypothetical protein